MGKISEENFLEMAKKVLALPKTKDKVVCFVSDWEAYKSSSIMLGIDPGDEKYVLKEENIFRYTRGMFLLEGHISFLLFRQFDKKMFLEDCWDGVDPMAKKGFEALKKGVFNNPKEEKKFEIDLKLREATDHISILPDTPDFRKFQENNKKTVDQHELKILSVDYSLFPYGILFEFLKYMNYLALLRNKKEIKEKISPELAPLHRLFLGSSLNVRIFYATKIVEIIEKIYKKEIMTVAEMDEINFLSKNHLQEIDKPRIWRYVESNGGYLCKGNLRRKPESGGSREDDGKISVRFFYSLSSLLFWELLQCINSVRRCENCNEPLPAKRNGKIFKGKNCIKGMRSFSTCNKERLRKRQKEFKINLENFS